MLTPSNNRIAHDGALGQRPERRRTVGMSTVRAEQTVSVTLGPAPLQCTLHVQLYPLSNPHYAQQTSETHTPNTTFKTKNRPLCRRTQTSMI